MASADRISFYFKTRKSAGLLFYTGGRLQFSPRCAQIIVLLNPGERGDYLTVFLSGGGVSLAINLGSGKLSTAIKPDGEQFNDNVWHQVTIRRESHKVRLAY